MNTLTELYIFEPTSKERNTNEQGHRWSNALEAKHLPYAFARGFLLASDLVMIGIALYLSITTQAPIGIRVVLELLFVSAYALLLFARSTKQYWRVVSMYLVAIGIAFIMNLILPEVWEGAVILYMLYVTLCYRFPLNWALPLAIPGFFVQIAINRGVLGHLPALLGGLGVNLAIIIGVCWLGWTRRTQYLLIVRLRETQEQLRQQMVRSEALAAERERTRIARDIHDVLSHSLAVLSIQVQAARHLRTRDTERLAAKLDEMATLIRESITESRRVVGLLREQPGTLASQDSLSKSLQSFVLTFSERTGITCSYEENGIAYEVSIQHREVLQLALREMLTNAHRHGSAKTAHVMLQWREMDMLMQVCDDGMGANGTQTATSQQEPGGHHGLQGMRERAVVLGGEVNAGPRETGGFQVSIRLPYEPPSKNTIKTGSRM